MVNNNVEIIASKIINEELESLRKRFYPYKKRPFLENKVILKIHKKDRNTVKDADGYYTFSKTKNEYKYTHIIHITKGAIERCNYLKVMRGIKTKDLLRGVIRHELIHAFVYENWETWDFKGIKGIEADYSPIFLSCLYWANGYTTHTYTKQFYNTELFNKIKSCKSYDVIQSLLLDYLLNYEHTLEKLSKNNGISMNEVSINFSSDDAGLTNRSCYESIGVIQDKNKLQKINICNLELSAGFLVTPDYLEKCYKNKFDNRDSSIIYRKYKIYYGKNQNIISEKRVC